MLLSGLILVLKRLADALRDRDPIFGLIHGVGLSNDIGGNLLAPDSEGQVRAMTGAYDNGQQFGRGESPLAKLQQTLSRPAVCRQVVDL